MRISIITTAQGKDGLDGLNNNTVRSRSIRRYRVVGKLAINPRVAVKRTSHKAMKKEGGASTAT